MMTAKMMEAMKNAGIAKEWHKADMHRLYIDLAKADEMYRNNCEHFEWGGLNINRREKSGGKVWIDLENGEISTKYIYMSEAVIKQVMELAAFLAPEETEEAEETKEAEEAEETEETEEAAKEAMTADELHALCKETGITLTEDKHIITYKKIDTGMIARIKANKDQIIEALSGYCFADDVHTSDRLHNWSIVKASSIASVSYQPETIFSGTALEVDNWARQHKDDVMFTDLYTSKYYYRRDDWCIG